MGSEIEENLKRDGSKGLKNSVKQKRRNFQKNKRRARGRSD